MPAAATDVVVLGAGPVGCVAALALRAAGRKVRLVSDHAGAAGFRPIVLSYASRLILERLGVWPQLAASTIDTIHVSQAGGFGRTMLSARDAGVPGLGYVLEYSELVRVLRLSVQDLFSEHQPPARCVVHAEGAASEMAETRYAQDALVAAVRFRDAPRDTAFERFTAEGPLALLPLGEQFALVWSMRPPSAQRALSMGESEFLQALADAAGMRPGRPVAVRERALQPLSLKVRESRVAERAVYIGNAAQALHPVAGQGLNLGLRDAWELAQVMRDAPDPGAAATLRQFDARRRLDAGAAIRATDLLATIFVRKNPFTGLALTALDIFPGPRRFFARRMIFGPSALP